MSTDILNQIERMNSIPSVRKEMVTIKTEINIQRDLKANISTSCDLNFEPGKEVFCANKRKRLNRLIHTRY